MGDSIHSISKYLFANKSLKVVKQYCLSFEGGVFWWGGEVMKSSWDIEIVYKSGIVKSFKGKSKKLTKKESKRIQKHIDAIVKSYAEDDW